MTSWVGSARTPSRRVVVSAVAARRSIREAYNRCVRFGEAGDPRLRELVIRARMKRARRRRNSSTSRRRLEPTRKLGRLRRN
jgi:hypothetical protein